MKKECCQRFNALPVDTSEAVVSPGLTGSFDEGLCPRHFFTLNPMVAMLQLPGRTAPIRHCAIIQLHVT